MDRRRKKEKQVERKEARRAFTQSEATARMPAIADEDSAGLSTHSDAFDIT